MRIIFYLFCILLFSCQIAFAGSIERRHNDLQLQMSTYTYVEPDIQENGTLFGMRGSNYYNLTHSFMAALDFSFGIGSLDYVGALMDGTPYTMNGIPYFSWDFRGLMGYEFPAFEKSLMTLYVGLGYRYQRENSETVDPAGYQRESNYQYVPIGLDEIRPLGIDWQLKSVIEYDLFLSGIQKSRLSDFDSNVSDLTNNQSRGYGFRSSIKLTRKYKDVDFGVDLFAKFWSIEESDHQIIEYSGVPVAEGWEPKNNSSQYGISLAIEY